MHRRSRLPLAAFAVATFVLGGVPAVATIARTGTAAPRVQAPNGIIDDEDAMAGGPNCNTAQLTGPHAVSAASLTGGPSIALDVLVLVDVAEGASIASMSDRAARARAEAAVYEKVTQRLRKAATSYAPLDVALTFRQFGLLQPLVNGKPRDRVTDTQQIMDLAKKQLGGARPSYIDVVYVVTDLDITSPALGSAVAGQADCIGGVGHPDRAFAVGETPPLNEDEKGIDFFAVTLWPDYSAKIFAHELGHLFGAHHHYQECGTAVGSAYLENHEPGPCTLMTNLVDFQSFPFSTLNGAIVRGHAEEFAAR